MAEEFFTWLQREKRLELSAQQRQAVETTEGAVLLTATPGSGKTTVIVCRTAYLLREKKIPAGQILTLTFGKQSQLDMDRRFAALFPEMEKPRFSTLHALSLSILRRYCEITGGAMFSLLPDSTPVVRELLRKQINGFISEELLRNALSALEYEAVQTGKHTAQSVEGCDMEQLLQDYALYKRERRLMDFPTCCAMPTVRWSACRHCWRNCRRAIPMCRSTKRRTPPPFSSALPGASRSRPGICF